MCREPVILGLMRFITIVLLFILLVPGMALAQEETESIDLLEQLESESAKPRPSVPSLPPPFERPVGEGQKTASV
ncbi:MAG: hypothetical protein LRZ85_03480 [Alphaproteobacteria bacterium]|nr:hypothetical protein [Alphaproteobacteria bacterium]